MVERERQAHAQPEQAVVDGTGWSNSGVDKIGSTR